MACSIESNVQRRGGAKIIENVCCFFGHREISVTEELKADLCERITNLIVKENVDTFLFGSKSKFNDLCYELVTKLKKSYPAVRRIYVRAEYPFISSSFQSYLLESYEDTYYPQNVIGSNRLAYVKRNFEMIDKSHFCIVYCEETYRPKTRKSGTKIALDYALKKKKTIFRFPIPDID